MDQAEICLNAGRDQAGKTRPLDRNDDEGRPTTIGVMSCLLQVIENCGVCGWRTPRRCDEIASKASVYWIYFQVVDCALWQEGGEFQSLMDWCRCADIFHSFSYNGTRRLHPQLGQ
jgi:hypothetical protein